MSCNDVGRVSATCDPSRGAAAIGVAVQSRAVIFDLTDEQAAIQGLARDFARQEVKPAAEELDREKRFP